VHDADDRDAEPHERDRDADGREPVQEVGRSVQWVDEPAHVAAPTPALLAEHRQGWRGAFERGPYRCLAGRVDVADPVAGSLLTCIPRRPELLSDDRAAGRALGRDLIALTTRMPRLARARARLETHLSDIIDGGDLIRLSERELMAPLDAEARRLVGIAAKRVSVVTAVSPRAAVDMFFVLVTALGLVRRLALLYGGRPGTLGLFKLMRQAVTHIAVTGGMAASDSVIQQMIGHGVAAKLSARLGEGVLNGLLTARLGLAAIEAARPLPFAALRQPALNDIAGSLLRGGEKRGTETALQDKRPP